MTAARNLIETELGVFDPSVMEPIDGDPEGKSLLSMHQFSAADIGDYFEEAAVAERIITSSERGLPVLPYAVLKAVMRQPSTRTGGSLTSAMSWLGGIPALYSGMEASSEAKGEPFDQSMVALASQANVLGIRTKEEFGPHVAAHAIVEDVRPNGLPFNVPVINLGDGTNEHPTQALGDLYTINKRFNHVDGLTIVIAGDHARYRAFHSLMIGAAAMGANILAVEHPASPVPEDLVDELGMKLERTDDLDAAMREADVLYMGRKPDEYDKTKGVNLKELPKEDRKVLKREKRRNDQLQAVYRSWVITRERVQNMKTGAVVMHPRPLGIEIDPAAEADHRLIDVQQMFNMIPMRMAILARHLGSSIINTLIEAETPKNSRN